MDRKEYIESLHRKQYIKRCHRKQKVKITFECELPGYNADGDPLQAFAYVAMKVGNFVWTPKEIHSVQLEQIDNFTDETD